MSQRKQRGITTGESQNMKGKSFLSLSVLSRGFFYKVCLIRDKPACEVGTGHQNFVCGIRAVAI